MTALQILAIVAGLVVAVIVTALFNQWVWLIIALIGGVAAGIVTYKLITRGKAE